MDLDQIASCSTVKVSFVVTHMGQCKPDTQGLLSFSNHQLAHTRQGELRSLPQECHTGSLCFQTGGSPDFIFAECHQTERQGFGVLAKNSACVRGRWTPPIAIAYGVRVQPKGPPIMASVAAGLRLACALQITRVSCC